MNWDIYDYDNDAQKYLKQEAQRKKQIEMQKSWKKSPASLESKYQKEFGTQSGKPVEPESISTSPLIERPMSPILEMYNRAKKPTEYIKKDYEENIKTLFPKLKKPDFTKTEILGSKKPQKDLAVYAHVSNLSILPVPRKVYKYKVVDPKTEEELITPQKEIIIVAENQHNYYYYQDKVLKSVRKDETTDTKLTSKELEERYMENINQLAIRVRKMAGTSFKKTPDNIKIPEEERSPLETGINEAAKFILPGLSKITSEDVQPTDLAKNAILGFNEEVNFLPALVDRITKGNYAHDEEYFKEEKFKLVNGKLPADVAKRIDARKKLETEDYPLGYSRETDVMAKGGNKKEVAKAREEDKLALRKSFTGKEKFSTAENIAKGTGTVAGVITNLIGIGKLAPGAKSRYIAKASEIITGGAGYGFLKKLREKDATAIDYLKSTAEETAYYALGEGALKGVKEAAKAGVKYIPKVASKIIKPKVIKQAEKVIDNIDTKYGLNKSVKGLSKKEKAAIQTDTTKKLVNDIGERVKAKIGSSEPQKVMEYYNTKYKLSKGKIKISKNLRSENLFARVETKGKDLIVKINPNKSENEIVGALRHEVEHIIDKKAGFKIAEQKINNPNTVKELLYNKGHHGTYDNFEIGYLENALKKEAKGSGEIIESSVRQRMALETPDASKFKQEVLHEKNRQLTKATNLPDYEPKKGGIIAGAKNKAHELYRVFINDMHYIDRTGQKIKMTAANYKRYHTVVNGLNTRRLVDKAGRTINNKSLMDVLSAPKNYQAEFESYLFHRHNLMRIVKGKPVIVDEAGRGIGIGETKDAIARYESEFPQFKKAAGDLYQWQDDFFQEYAVDGDLITQKQYDDIQRLYKDYVPTWRAEEFVNSNMKLNKISTKIMKKAKGGAERLVPLSQAMPMNIQRVVRAQAKNKIYQSLYDEVLNNAEAMQKFAQVVDTTKGLKGGIRKELKEAVEKIANGKDINSIFDNLENTLVTDGKNGNFLVVLEKGKKLVLKINDTGLWKTLERMQKTTDEDLVKYLRTFNKYATDNFKGVITRYNPFFAIRNISRDLPTAYIQGSVHNPLTYTKNLFTGLTDILGKKELYKQFEGLGGKSTNISQIEKVFQEANPKWTKKALQKIGEGLNFFSSLSETLPRYAEFAATYKRGAKMGMEETAALREALFNSGEVTVNFSRGGTITKNLDAIFPYMNAGVQGFDKWIRTMALETAKGNFKPVLKSLGAITVPTILFNMWNKAHNYENYNKVPDYVRDNNYLVPIGDTKYLKIPKNRETGFVFSTLLDRMYRFYVEKDDTAFEGLGTSFKQGFYNPATDVLSGGILGPAQNIYSGGNKNYFGQNIEPTSMQLDKRSKRYIKDERTSKMSAALGPILEKVGLSPMQSDYLITSYTGILGKMYIAFDDKNKSLSEKLEKMSSFTTDTAYSSKTINKKYEEKDLAQKKLRDFEIENGLIELRKKLRAEKKGTAYIDRELENILGDSYQTYIKLKEKTKD